MENTIASIEIREALEADLPAILALYNDMVLHTTTVYNETPHTLEMRRQWLSEKQAGNWPVLVATVHNKFAGFATYGTWRAWQGYRFTAEHSVYLQPEFQAQGIGRLLMTELIQRARMAGLHVLVAGVDASNASSIRFHEKLGFKTIGIFPEVGYKFNRWLNLCMMQKILQTTTDK